MTTPEMQYERATAVLWFDQHASKDSNEKVTGAKGVVDDIVEVQKNTTAYFSMIMLAFLVMVLIMRAGAKRRGRGGNDIVAAAKVLIDADRHNEAREMLLEHLQENPGDDRAKAVLAKTRS